MRSNILVTGAAGYIGGSLVTDFLASNNTLIQKGNISATVRSTEQAEALSKLGINVLQLNLTNENAVVESVLRHKISIVIHCASSIEPSLALHLITALGKQKELSGDETYFIHTSALSAFCEKTGWPPGEFKDTGPLFDLEKQLADSFPVRRTDVAVIEHAKARGVTSFIVVPPAVYGKGSGEWNKLSAVLPVYVRAGISRKSVYKFAENTKLSGVHISDMTALYGLIVEKILQEKALPSGTEGYYFARAHDFHWWKVLDQLALTLKSRGLVRDSTVHTWPSDEAASEALGVPVQFVQLLWNSGEATITENTHRIGWKPGWNEERFLQNMDDEVQAVLELGQAKSSGMESLRELARG